MAPKHMFCFECNEHVVVEAEDLLTCPVCDGGFLEEMPPERAPPPFVRAPLEDDNDDEDGDGSGDDDDEDGNDGDDGDGGGGDGGGDHAAQAEEWNYHEPGGAHLNAALQQLVGNFFQAFGQGAPAGPAPAFGPLLFPGLHIDPPADAAPVAAPVFHPGPPPAAAHVQMDLGALLQQMLGGVMAGGPGAGLFGAVPGPHGQLGDYVVGDAGMAHIMQQLLEQAQSAPDGNQAARPERVQTLHAFKITPDFLARDGADVACYVCQGPYEAGEDARKMPCNHMFHAECLLPWLDMHSTCPVCRLDLNAQTEHPAVGAEHHPP